MVELVATRPLTVPDDVMLGVGDWAHNLRSSLDQLVYTYVTDPGDRARCQFPVWRHESVPTEVQWARRVADAVPGQDAAALRAAIETLEPWKGGRDEWLWALTELNNADKHRVMLDVAVNIATTRRATAGQWISETGSPT